MPKRMEDGERREMRVPEDKIWKGRRTLPKVFAIREDCDTPYVEVTFKDQVLMLTDTDALALYQKIGKALEILPTSK